MKFQSGDPKLHWWLVKPVILERAPAPVSLLLLAGLAASGTMPLLLRGWIAGGLWLLAFMLCDWLSLCLLPRTGRSYGPVNPPLYALAGLRAGLMAGVSLLWPAGWRVGLILQGLLMLVSVYATWLEPFRLEVAVQRLSVRSFSGTLRLLHIADLHVERLSPREKRLQELVVGLKPDVIVFTGDFINLSYPDDPTAETHIRQLVGAWNAPLGVYCVSGTPLVETSGQVARFVAGSRLRWLRDETVLLETPAGRIRLAGLDGAMRRSEVLPRLPQVAREVAADALNVLLYHTPDVAPEAAAAGFDLYLCGHTHGGQIRLPFYGALVTASEWGKRFEMGRYALGQMVLYVSRGLGMEGGSAPRARFLCPPEMTLWELSGE